MLEFVELTDATKRINFLARIIAIEWVEGILKKNLDFQFFSGDHRPTSQWSKGKHVKEATGKLSLLH